MKSPKRKRTFIRRTVVTKNSKITTKNICFLNDQEFEMNIINLFKEDEIFLSSKLDPNDDQKGIYKIEVKDKDHPILKYVENKAVILCKGRKYRFPNLPMLNRDEVLNIDYDPDGHKRGILKIETDESKSTDFNNFVIRNRQTITFFELDGKVYSSEEYYQKKMEIGDPEMEILGIIRGKEAVNKYKDQKYSVGVMRLKTIE